MVGYFEIVLVLEYFRLRGRGGKTNQASTASSSPDLGEVPLYSCSLLRRVRMLTSSNLAAWVRLPLQRSSAAKICCFSNSESVGNSPELLTAPGVAPMSAGAAAAELA